MAAVSAEGQAMELGWIHDNVTDLQETDYLEMVLKKTCWLATIYPIRVGALIATRDTVDLESFVRFGFFLGAAFQIHDDVLNLVGEHDKYGKELNGDLLEGKRTLMLIRLYREATDGERQRLDAILSKRKLWRRRTCGMRVRTRVTLHVLFGQTRSGLLGWLNPRPRHAAA